MLKSAYAWQKFTIEDFAKMCADLFNLDVVCLRYFNVFGKRQSPNGPYAAVIPRWIDAMLRKDEIHINGDGETSRDFCHIENVIQANLLAATCQQKKGLNQVYNVAVGDRNSLNDLFNILKQELIPHKIQYDIEPIYRDFRPGDVRHSQADISKIKNLLGYSPEYNLLNGIRESLPWFVSKFNQHA